MFRCVISGKVLEDGYEDKTFDGKTVTSRVTNVHQKGNKEVISIKNIPDNFIYEEYQHVTVPCIGVLWKQGDRYGVSFKYDDEVSGGVRSA